MEMLASLILHTITLKKLHEKGVLSREDVYYILSETRRAAAKNTLPAEYTSGGPAFSMGQENVLAILDKMMVSYSPESSKTEP